MPPRSSYKRAIFFIVLAMFVFSLLNAIVKETIPQYSPVQLAFFRFFFAAFPSAFFILARGLRIRPSSEDWKIHGKRAFLFAFAMPVLFFGIGSLPLANSMAIYFSGTLFLVGLSYPILREKPTLIQWVAVAVGFLGVLIVAKPDAGVFHWGAVFVALGACAESTSNLYGRLLTNTHNGYVLTFLGSLLPALILLIPLPFFWVTPVGNDWIKLIMLGIGGGVGQLCITFAYRYASAGTIAPLIYSAILWSILLDVVLYGLWPTISLLIGCGIIIAAGLIIVFSERRRALAQG